MMKKRNQIDVNDQKLDATKQYKASDHLMNDNDPEWNADVAEFSQSYSNYSFQTNGMNEVETTIVPDPQDPEIKDIWY